MLCGLKELRASNSQSVKSESEAIMGSVFDAALRRGVFRFLGRYVKSELISVHSIFALR